MLSEAHGGKDDGERRGSEDVIDRQIGANAAAQRTLPHLDVAAIGPGHRLSGRVVERGEGHRLRLASRHVLGEACDLPFAVVGKDSLQQLPEGRGVDQPLHARGHPRAARDELRSPAEDVVLDGIE